MNWLTSITYAIIRFQLASIGSVGLMECNRQIWIDFIQWCITHTNVDGYIALSYWQELIRHGIWMTNKSKWKTCTHKKWVALNGNDFVVGVCAFVWFHFTKLSKSMPTHIGRAKKKYGIEEKKRFYSLQWQRLISFVALALTHIHYITTLNHRFSRRISTVSNVLKIENGWNGQYLSAFKAIFLFYYSFHG